MQDEARAQRLAVPVPCQAWVGIGDDGEWLTCDELAHVVLITGDGDGVVMCKKHVEMVGAIYEEMKTMNKKALQAVKDHISGYMEDNPEKSVICWKPNPAGGYLVDIWATEWPDVVGVAVRELSGGWDVEILGEGLIQVQPTPSEWAAIYAMPDLELAVLSHPITMAMVP